MSEVIGHRAMTASRVAAMRRLGIRFEDVATTNIMLHTTVHATRQVVGAGSVVGRHCLFDGRGGLRTGRDVNTSSYVRMMTGTHDARSPTFAGSHHPSSSRTWPGLPHAR